MRAVGVVTLLLLASSAPARSPVDCEAARCAVQSAVGQGCPCAEGATRSEHFRCVARVVRDLVRDGTVPLACRRSIKHCATRSVCGRPAGAVACDIPEVMGTCAIGLGFCHHPDGTILYTHPCSSDADCVIESRCRITPSAERCMARGGTVAAGPNCCAGCGPAVGTPCGPGLNCNADEICVIFGPVGPGGFNQTCHPVPEGCEENRTCGCVSDALCPAPHICYDTEIPGDVIFCECTACV